MLVVSVRTVVSESVLRVKETNGGVDITAEVVAFVMISYDDPPVRETDTDW